jgi:hypothetical protein
MGTQIGLHIANIMHEQNFKRFEDMGWRLAAMQPYRKNYVIGHDVLFVKQPENLPKFFTKVEMLCHFREISGTKARALLRDAVVAVGSGTGMTYRIGERAADKLKQPVPPGGEAWVADQARKITQKLQKGRTHAEAVRRRLERGVPTFEAIRQE